MPPMQMDINDPLNIGKEDLTSEIGILEVKTGVQVSKNTNHFHTGLGMPPMQMDLTDPLNIRKEELTSQK